MFIQNYLYKKKECTHFFYKNKKNSYLEFTEQLLPSTLLLDLLIIIANLLILDLLIFNLLLILLVLLMAVRQQQPYK